MLLIRINELSYNVKTALVSQFSFGLYRHLYLKHLEMSE